jgi:predicted MPP superfamily phosphohydrolase
MGLLGLLASYTLFIERYIVLTNTYRIPVPNLPKAFSGFRIVQVADPHFGFLMPLGIIRDVVSRVNRLSKDIVVCTGDYVHMRNTTTEIDSVWPVLSELSAPGGVYSVLGNHDHWADTNRSRYWLRESGQDVERKVVPLQREGSRIWLAGAGDQWEDPVSLDHLLKDVPQSDCRIVLAHNPDTADTECSVRVDLMISGHTHGGQVKIPFIGTPILPVKNKNYSSGLKRSPKGSHVYISRGIGWAVLPVRFNCYPEISVLELFPA